MTSPLDQKIKIKGSVVITANRLADGAVVYRTADGKWTTDLDQAIVVTTADEATVLLQAAAGEGVLAVGAYPAPVEIGPDKHILPGNLREWIRLRGPTVDYGPAPVAGE